MSLYSSTLVTFEDDKGAYDQKDAAGFISSTRCVCARLACATAGSNQRRFMQMTRYCGVQI